MERFDLGRSISEWWYKNVALKAAPPVLKVKNGQLEQSGSTSPVGFNSVLDSMARGPNTRDPIRI